MDKEIKLIIDTAESTKSLEELTTLLERLKGLIANADSSNLDELNSAFTLVENKVLSLTPYADWVDTNPLNNGYDRSEWGYLLHESPSFYQNYGLSILMLLTDRGQ